MSAIRTVLIRHAGDDPVAAFMDEHGLTEHPDVSRALKPSYGGLMADLGAGYGIDSAVREVGDIISDVMGGGIFIRPVYAHHLTGDFAHFRNNAIENIRKTEWAMVVVEHHSALGGVHPGETIRVFAKNNTRALSVALDVLHEWTVVPLKGIKDYGHLHAVIRAAGAHIGAPIRLWGPGILTPKFHVAKVQRLIKEFKEKQKEGVQTKKELIWHLKRAWAPYTVKTMPGTSNMWRLSDSPIPVRLHTEGVAAALKVIKITMGGALIKGYCARVETDGVVRNVDQDTCDKVIKILNDFAAIIDTTGTS